MHNDLPLVSSPWIFTTQSHQTISEAGIQLLPLQIAMIASNPEQSKHLKTTSIKAAGLELDSTDQRNEEFADHILRDCAQRPYICNAAFRDTEQPRAVEAPKDC